MGFIDFISNGTLKSFEDYCMTGKQKRPRDTKRIYVVGQYRIENEKKHTYWRSLAIC